MKVQMVATVRHLAALAQVDKALEAEAVEQLEFRLLIAQAKQLLNKQHPDRQFGRDRRATATFVAGAQRSMID
nr:hypothetical protein [Duganella levis]